MRSLRHIFFNLFSNSIQHSSSGSQIVILGEKANVSMISLSVIDDGPGIPIELHEVVFDPFVQRGRALNNRHGGLRLLSVSRELAHAMNGRLKLRSMPAAGSRLLSRCQWRAVRQRQESSGKVPPHRRSS